MQISIHFLDDDYAINRFHEITLIDVVKEFDCKVQFYDCSVELLSNYKNGTVALPDLLYLDVNMPKLDGWKFLDAFISSFSEAKTKVVILTTSTNPSYLEKSLNYESILKFEFKPLNPESLHEVIMKLKPIE